MKLIAGFSEKDVAAIRELESLGMTVVLDGPRVSLHFGPCDSVPALLRRLLHHGWRAGAAPVCPDCMKVAGSCEFSHGGLSDGAPGVGEAISGAPSLRLVGS